MANSWRLEPIETLVSDPKTQLNITLNWSTFPFSEHWHPEFMEYEEKTHPYQAKAFRSEDWMKKKGLGRRYNKYLPKLSIPLEDEAAVYKLPKTEYEKDQDQFWGSWEWGKIVNWFKLFILDAELPIAMAIDVFLCFRFSQCTMCIDIHKFRLWWSLQLLVKTFFFTDWLYLDLKGKSFKNEFRLQYLFLTKIPYI